MKDEKYLKVRETFTVSIEKEVTRIDKNGEEITKNISFMLRLIDTVRFMASLLSNLVNNNLFERTHRIKCKFRHNEKNVKHAELIIRIANFF